MISETIGTQLVTLLTGVVDIVLSEDQTETYPYAVYKQTVQPITDKMAVIGYESDMTIYVYSKDFDEAYQIMGNVKDAIASGMSGDGYTAFLQTEEKACLDEVWEIASNYRIIQID